MVKECVKVIGKGVFSTSCLKQGFSIRLGSSWPCPVEFWASPSVQIPQPLWAPFMLFETYLLVSSRNFPHFSMCLLPFVLSEEDLLASFLVQDSTCPLRREQPVVCASGLQNCASTDSFISCDLIQLNWPILMRRKLLELTIWEKK